MLKVFQTLDTNKDKLPYLDLMERHEAMTTDQALLAVVHAVGTIRTREFTYITAVCTVSFLHSLSSIVAEHLLEVSVLISEPFLHGFGAPSLFGFLFSLSISHSRIIVLYISLIFNIFGKQVVGFWVFRGQHSESFWHWCSRYCMLSLWQVWLIVIAMKSDNAPMRGIWTTDMETCWGFLFLWGRHWKLEVYVLTWHISSTSHYH